jgi:hypothetical protein
MAGKSDKTETVEPETQVVEEAVATEPEKKEEEFDKERAMNTIRQLREVEKKAKADAKRLADYEKAEQSRIDAEKSELQKAQDRADKAEADAKATKLALLRRDVATETKLPAELADFLRGETPEELTASAQTLLKSIPAKVAPAGTVTNPGTNATNKGETDAERRKRLGLQ